MNLNSSSPKAAYYSAKNPFASDAQQPTLPHSENLPPRPTPNPFGDEGIDFPERKPSKLISEVQARLVSNKQDADRLKGAIVEQQWPARTTANQS